MSANLAGLVNQLRATLGKMEVALGAIADAIVWTGKDTKVQWCNAAFDKLVNRPHIMVLGEQLSDLLPLSQAGQPVAPSSYPDVRLLSNEYEATSQYEFQQGDRSLILEISGNCVELTSEDKSAVLVIRDVTQAKRLEAERQQIDEALQHQAAAIQASVDGIAILDSNQTYIYLNESYAKSYGYNNAQELIGKNWQALYDEAELRRLEQELMPKFSIRGQWRGEAIGIRRDGSKFPQELSLTAIQNGEWICIVRDISVRKKAEAALRRSEEKFRNIFENSQVGIMRTTRFEDGLILDANQRLIELTGYSCAAEVIGKRFTTEFYVNLDERQRMLTQLRQNGKVNNFEMQFRQRDGTLRWGLFSLQLNAEETCVEVVVTDITDHKQAEADLRRSNAILKAQQEASIDGILVVDENQRIVSYNQRFCQLWQIPATLIHSGSDQQLRESVLDKLEQPEEFLAKVEYLYKHPEEVSRDEICLKDGQTLDRYSAPVRSCSVSEGESPKGDYYGRIWYFRDITERKQAEESLRRSEQKYRNIFENSQVGIGRTRLGDGLFLDVNQRCAEIVGYSSAADLICKRFTTDFYVNPDDRQRVLTQLAHHGEARNLEIQMRRPDGSVCWGLFSLRLNAEEGCIDSVIADISDRKQAEAELKRAVQQLQQEITERQRVEAALKDSEERFQLAVYGTFDGIWDWDLRTNQVFLSPIYVETLGYREGELSQELSSWSDNVHPDDFPVALRAVQDHLDGKTPIYTCVFRMKHKHGHWLWIEAKGICIRDELGKPYRMTGTQRDISDRKQADEALLRSEQRLRRQQTGLIELAESQEFYSGNLNAALQALTQKAASILNVERVSVWFYDTVRLKICLNNLYQLSQQQHSSGIELSAKDYPAYFQALETDEVIAADEAQRDPRTQEFRDWLTPLGITSVLDVPIRSGGKTVGVIFHEHVGSPRHWTLEEQNFASYLAYMASLAIEAYERVSAETALQHRAQVDSLLSSISRHFIDHDVDTAIHFTLETVAQFVGAERTCIFELSDDQSYGYLIHEWCAVDIEPLSNGARGSPIEMFPRFSQILSGNVFQIPCVAELPAEAAERQLFESQSIQSVVVVPMLHSGKVVGFIGTDAVHFSKTWNQEDINLLRLVGELIAIGRSRHKAEEAVRVAKEAAEAANRAKSVFLANMSHELRTPLNAILGFAQLMERDATLTLRQRESLTTINRSGEHLLNLINDVLEMSKIEAGRIALNPAPCELYRFLQAIEDMVQVRADAKALSLQVELASDLPQYILVDEGKLRQVLINLLGNAIKFTDTGGVRLRVTSTPNKLNFEIHDTGRGIAAEELDHLFQPFVQTTSGTQVNEGTGLGLTISRQFVQLMGGDIEVNSAVGLGSTFSFEISVELTEPFASAPSTLHRRVLQLAPNQPVYRLLTVDDRTENNELLTHLLNSVGFETRSATNGQEAITQWQAWQPHLIWMDMRMPVTDGYEATQHIRRLEPLHTTKIIALTASAFEEQRSRILAVGCDDLVRKPFREQIIFDKLAEHLGVQYLYAESLPKNEVGRQEDEEIDSALLQVMPVEWITALHQAAIEVDADLILQLIEQVPKSHSALARGLAQLSDRFCFDEILELTQEILFPQGQADSNSRPGNSD